MVRGRYWGKCLDRKGARVRGVHPEGIYTFYYILPVGRSPARAKQSTPLKKNNKWDLGAFDMPSSWLSRSDQGR